MLAGPSLHKEMDVNSIITLVLVVLGAMISGFRLLFAYERLLIERRREQHEIVSF